STFTSPVDFAWHARMTLFSLSPGSRPSSTAMLTRPDSSFTRHVPQVPTRHELSISTPALSATSRTVLSGGSGADLPDRQKVTTGKAAAPALAGSVACGRAGSGLPSAGPNASVLTLSAGTPSSPSIFLTASISGTGPHRWT